MALRQIAALQRTVLFSCLTETQLAEVARHAKTRHFQRGEMLFFQASRRMVSSLL